MQPLKIGLVLSGGGAKGAYQIGTFRALAQLNMVQQVTAVSGCSIGALNALLFAGGGEEQWTAAWEGLTYDQFLLREQPVSGLPETGILPHSIKDLVALIHTKAAEAKTLGELLARNDLSPFSEAGLAELLRKYVDFSVLETVPPYVWVCAYNMEREEPEYFALSGLPKEDAIRLALASA
ncbi:MAG: patatin-like phospholipase family protein, partial [Angelakisella sp.]